jgi:hypothetical protein
MFEITTGIFSMGLESEERRKRRQLIDRVDREIIRDLLSVITLQVTIETGKKHSRSEALREVLMKHFEAKPEVRRQILAIDEKRNLKDL